LSTSKALGVSSAIIEPAAGEAYSVTVTNNNYDAIITEVNKMPRGIQAINELTAASPNIPALQVVQNIASFTFKANRRYVVKWTGGIYCTNVANIQGLIQIQSCSTADSSSATTNLTELMGWNIEAVGQNVTQRFAPEREIMYTSDTTLQIKGTFNPTGGGTWIVAAGPTFPAQLSITDVGAQF
jgi:hypothetical protein